MNLFDCQVRICLLNSNFECFDIFDCLSLPKEFVFIFGYNQNIAAPDIYRNMLLCLRKSSKVIESKYFDSQPNCECKVFARGQCLPKPPHWHYWLFRVIYNLRRIEVGTLSDGHTVHVEGS